MIKTLLSLAPITDWIMVVITIVYVFATIAIFITNHNATKAAQDSIKEMRREFEEMNRPLVEVEFVYVQKTFLALRFSNHGRQTAYNVTIDISQDFIDSLDEAVWLNEVNKQKDKTCIIGVGQHYDLFFGDRHYLKKENKIPVTGKVKYESNGRKYTDEFYVNLDKYMTIYSVTTDEEKLRELIRNQNQELKNIREQLAKMNNDG